MVAHGEDNCYSFKNVCGFLRISLTGGNIVESTRADKETPTTTMSATGAIEVMFDGGNGVVLSEQATDFVFALPLVAWDVASDGI